MKHALAVTTSEYDRRLAELSYDFNRRISATNAEFDKLAALVRRSIPTQPSDEALAAAALPQPVTSDLTAAVVAAAANSILSSSESVPRQRNQVNLLHSLSQVAAAHALQQQQQQNGQHHAMADEAKRPLSTITDEPPSKQPRPSEDV